MIGIHNGIYSPVLMLVEARGNLSARSSVSINSCLFFNPGECIPQEFSTSGFYAPLREAVGDVFSTAYWFGLIPKIIPTRCANCVTDCAESSLRAAPVSKVTFSSQSHWRLATGALFLGRRS